MTAQDVTRIAPTAASTIEPCDLRRSFGLLMTSVVILPIAEPNYFHDLSTPVSDVSL
jgi:hypothetical protein